MYFNIILSSKPGFEGDLPYVFLAKIV